MKKKLFMLFLLIPIIAIAFVGCGGDFTTNAYRTLYTVGISYDTSMKSVADLYTQGKIDKEDLDKILVSAHKVAVTYQSAVTALAIYNKTKAAPDEEKLAVILADLTSAIVDLQNLIRVFAPSPEVILDDKLEVIK